MNSEFVKNIHHLLGWGWIVGAFVVWGAGLVSSPKSA